MKKLMLIALSTLAMSAQAAQDIKFYAGGGIAQWQLDVPSTTGLAESPSGLVSNFIPQETTFTFASLELQGGAEVLPWLALELRAGFGLERDKETTFEMLSRVEQTVAVQGVDTDGNVTTVLEGTGFYDIEGAQTEATPELNYYVSFYVKPQLKNDRAALYGLLGLTAYDISVSYEETPVAAIESPAVTIGTGDNARTVVPIEYFYGDTAEPRNYDESEVTFSMGAGVAFFFEKITVNLEWKNYIQSSLSDDEEAVARAKGLSASVNYNF